MKVRELFQMLASYGMWMEDRERIINHLIATYSPDLVKIEHANDDSDTVKVIIISITEWY